MLQFIFEQNSPIFVENIAGMLCWALAGKDLGNVDWRATAEAEIAHSKNGVAKNGGLIVSEEDLFMLTFYRALDGKVKLS